MLEGSPSVCDKLLKSGKVNIGWKRCVVEEHIRILQCYNCFKFGHFAKDCQQNEPTCPNCSGPHKKDKCDKSVNEFRCSNCFSASQKFKIKLDLNLVLDKLCKSYLRLVNIEKTKIEK